MSFGLRVWDAQGRVTLDNIDNTGRLFAIVPFPAISSTSPITISVPGLDPGRMAYSSSVRLSPTVRITLQSGSVRIWLSANSFYQSAGSLRLIYIR